MKNDNCTELSCPIAFLDDHLHQALGDLIVAVAKSGEVAERAKALRVKVVGE